MLEPIYLVQQGEADKSCPPAAALALLERLSEIKAPPVAISSNGHAQESTFHLAHMDCPVEEQLIRKRLKNESGIEKLHFDLVQRQLTLHHQRDENELLNILASLGMEPRLLGGDVAPDEPENPRRAWWQLGAAAALAFGSEILAWTTRDEHSWPVAAMAIGAMFIGGREPLRKAVLALRHRTINIYLLMALAVAGAITIGHWPEAATVTVLFALSELIESYALDRARRAIAELNDLAPDVAEVRSSCCSDWHEVAAASVKVGDTARVRPGGRIPLDGIVREGESAVNQAPVTGESHPVDKAPGDEVFAGSVNGHGTFTFEVTAAQNDSTLARIARAVQDAHAQRAPVQRFIDEFARIYTPVVVLLAALSAIVPPLFFGAEWQPWFYNALVLLVIACPCALVISTPVTVVSGLAAGARRGLVIKGGLYLEQGRRLRALAFDKTGTLTLGQLTVTDVKPNNDYSADLALRLAASLNSASEHPVAAAIVGKARAQNLELHHVTHFEAIPGRGVRGTIDGTPYWLGNPRLADEHGATVPDAATQLESEAKTVVLLGQGSEVLALLALSDTPRPEAATVIQQLKASGIIPILLSGDTPLAVRAIAAQVGIEEARGGLLPEEKLTAIAELEQRFGAVGMVGDGINDAPALARAEVGFAMGAAGTGTALETADVALLQDDLRKLPLFLKLSRVTNAVLRQNIALALIIKVVFFILAFTGNATLWMAVFADVGASLLVILNGLRLLRFH